MQTDTELAQACMAWQENRSKGSTPIRAAARVLTGVPHYFRADFISAEEEAARGNPTTLRHARSLLHAVAAAEPQDVNQWRLATATSGTGAASRGLSAKPGDLDDQIEHAVRNTGVLMMPLWGFSLSESVARSYGERFLLRLHGRFSAVPAWEISGVKGHELELIGGGVYVVRDVSTEAGTTVVDLEQTATLLPLPGRYEQLAARS